MDWIKNLEVGDTVIISGYWNARIAAVEKITPSGRIKVDGMTFNPDGSERGGDAWHRSRLFEATPEVVREMQEKETIQKALREMRDVTKLSYNQAVEILKILEPPKELSNEDTI